jgi:hypothetical protein
MRLPMKRRSDALIRIALTVAFACALSACGSHHTRVKTVTAAGSTVEPPPQTTSSHIFAPFNGGEIASDVKIGKTGRGYCWTGSGADTRPDAWRCFLGNFILDPCFSNETGTSAFVICADSPWSSVTKLRLTKPLPSSQGNAETADPTAGRVWALELIDGTHCVALTGATGAIAGLGIAYGCDGGGVLAGEPRRTGGLWTIFFAPSFKASKLDEREIAEAWW